MTNVSINLLLVKFRQQFGLRAFTEGFWCSMCWSPFSRLFVNDQLSDDGSRRPRHGGRGAQLAGDLPPPVQAWPARHRLKELTIGITGSSLAIPLARLFSANFAQTDERRGLYFFELEPGAGVAGLRHRAKTAAKRS